MHASLGSHTCQPGAVQIKAGRSTPRRAVLAAPAAPVARSMQHRHHGHIKPTALMPCTSTAAGCSASRPWSSLRHSSSMQPAPAGSTSGSSHAWLPGRAHTLSMSSAHAACCQQLSATQTSKRTSRMQRLRACQPLAPVQVIGAMEMPVQSAVQPMLQPASVGSPRSQVLMPHVFTGAASTQGLKRRMEDMHFSATLHPQHGVQRHTIGGGADNAVSTSRSSRNGSSSSIGNSSSSSSSGNSSGNSSNGTSSVGSSRAHSSSGTSTSNHSTSTTNGSSNAYGTSSSTCSASGSCFGTAALPHVLMAGVLDGHAGGATAKYAAQELPALLHSTFKGNRLYYKRDAGGHACAAETAAALAYAFTCFDRWWDGARCDPKLTPHGWDESGATAVVSLLLGDLLVVGHSGDSSALLLRGGRTLRLSTPHRPCDNRAEAERVVRAGGRLVVSAPGQPVRVVGTSPSNRTRGAMITRALGDFAFKSPQPLLLSQPDVTHQVLSTEDTLLMMLSDGVTDVMTDEGVMAAATLGMAKARSSTSTGAHLAQAAAQAVVDAALAHGSGDNITAVAMLYEWSV